MGTSTAKYGTMPLAPRSSESEQTTPSRRDLGVWRSRRGSPFAPARLSLLRARTSWRLLATVGIGMLVAVTVLALVPLYSAVIANLELRDTLMATPPARLNVATSISVPILTQQKYSELTQRVESIRRSEIGAFAPIDSVSLRAAQGLTFAGFNGTRTADSRPDLEVDRLLPFAFEYTEALPHMTILEGRLPQDVPAGLPPEVMITPKLGAHVGDTITLSEFNAADQQFTVRVVGIWFPKANVSDPFWNGVNFDTQDTSIKDPPQPNIYPAMFTQQGLINAFTGLGPNPGIKVTFLSFTQPTAFDTSNLDSYAARLGRYRTRLIAEAHGTDIGVATPLSEILQRIREQLTILGLPLATIGVLIVALALLFVLIMASLLIESQRGELATLTSRGASSTQMMTGFMLQNVLMAAIIAPIGVELARVSTIALARRAIPGAATILTNTLVARVTPLDAAIPLALVGVLLSWIAVLLAFWQTARLDMLSFRRAQSRGGEAPLWQRLNLDIVLAVFCVAAYLELGQFGALDVRSQLVQLGAQTGLADSGVQSGPDPLLLVSPVLLLLAGALVVLRLFPLFARMGAWLAARSRGMAGMLAFAHIARVTAQFSRLALLLTLSVALALFALAFDASIEANAADRAAYEVGGDTRVSLSYIASGTGFAGSLATNYSQLPGVTGVTPVYRTVSRMTHGNDDVNVSTLGIDPTTFGQIAYWRPDYASRPLSSLLDDMRAHTTGAAAGQRNHPLWALVDDVTASELHLSPGDAFGASPAGGSITPIPFVVGAIVHAFPTLYASSDSNATTGFIIASEPDLLQAFHFISGSSVAGPTEYWLRTSSDARLREQRLLSFQANPNLYVDTSIDRRALEAHYRSDPLNAGIGSLLLIGAMLAALLAMLGSIVQSSISTSQRVSLFAVLRTLGMTRRQIRQLLLSEQSFVYLFGLGCGTALGLVLATATLPFLQFSGSLFDPATVGIPPYVLTFDVMRIAGLYAALLIAFVAALTVAAWAGLRVGIGKVLRVGDD